MTHRPCSWSGLGAPVVSWSFCLPSRRRGVRNDRAFHRARGATWVKHVASCAFRAHGSVHWWNSARRVAVDLSRHAATASEAAHTPCVPHAAVLSACNSQRRHAPGALTECLASPHCWVLGPPTSSAGRRPFTTSRGLPHRRAAARKARKRDGSVASRSAPVTIPTRPLPVQDALINIPTR